MVLLNGIAYDIYQNNQLCDMEIVPSKPITNGIRLASSDDYILKDTNGIYFTIKKEDE